MTRTDRTKFCIEHWYPCAMLEANWEITGCVRNFFRYSFKLSPLESSKSSSVSSGVFDTSSTVWSTFFPIPGCGFARTGLVVSVLALVGCHQPSLFLPQHVSSFCLAL
jgi:hypothetical protein